MLKEAFDRDGYVLVKGLVDKNTIQQQKDAINALVRARLHSLGSPSRSSDIDENINALLKISPSHAMDVIRATKDAPVFFAMMANPAILEASKECLGVANLLTVHDIAQFRIDPPHDDVRSFAWHQDFQYNVTSENSLTIWYPLTSITEDMGPLVVVPGSHRRMLPVKVDATRHVPGSGKMHNTIRLDVQSDDLEKSAVSIGPIEAGDALIFSSLLVHRSAPNNSTRSRLTMNPRYSDADDPAFVGRGWRSERDKTPNMFGEIYPGLVTLG